MPSKWGRFLFILLNLLKLLKIDLTVPVHDFHNLTGGFWLNLLFLLISGSGKNRNMLVFGSWSNRLVRFDFYLNLIIYLNLINFFSHIYSKTIIILFFILKSLWIFTYFYIINKLQILIWYLISFQHIRFNIKSISKKYNLYITKSSFIFMNLFTNTLLYLSLTNLIVKFKFKLELGLFA